MALKNNSIKYGSVAKTLHWLIALIVISLIVVGLLLEEMERGPQKLQVIGLHKSFGIAVLLLVAFRLIWKLKNITPFFPESMKTWEKTAARAGHGLLYFFTFAMPLSGWAMSSAAGYPVSLFGLVTLPNIVAADPELRRFFGEAHELMAWGLIVMIAVHAAAALLHHFYYKDNILLRMLPYGRLRNEKNYSRSDTMAGC